MIDRLSPLARTAAIAVAMLTGGAAGAHQVVPHRALYTMSLVRTSDSSGVTGARGTMAYQWGETCNGWTIEQRYRLRMGYSESPDATIASNFVTWEAKDGLRYRFNQQESRDGKVDEEIRGSATQNGPGKGGMATFEEPAGKSFKLPPGAMFPTAHTLMLLKLAESGQNFVAKQVFDGATVDGSALVSAVIGPKIEPDAREAKKNPLLDRPGWRVRLAFFPADPKAEKPDYELGMVLLDNGISRDMVIDYGDYAIRAKLDDVEALDKPRC
jgi:hypothetical protein